ncbi:MAG: carboxypeptidase regulatory-like domain-containing protein, partial [Terriglobia bacterium]
TTTGTQKQVINQTQMIELPLNGRNAADLTLLVAGAATPPSNGCGSLQGTSKEFPSEVAVSTNGAMEDQVGYYLDGGTYMDEFYSVNMPFPFPDALQEFSVQTSNYAAQYGNNAGGIVNIITKSGTNAIHGDLFEFNRNATLESRNFFEPKRDPLKQNQFGFTIGGPVVIPKVYNGRDRTFWFFGYQGTRISDIGSTASAFVPTQANLNGDFSAYLNASNPDNPTGRAVQIVNPATGQPFPGDIIPVSDFDPAALGAEKFFPHPGGSGLIFYQTPLRQDLNETDERVDHAFGSKDHLTVRGTWNNFANSASFVPSNILTLSSFSNITAQDYLLHETHIIRPNVLNDFRFSYWRLISTRGPASGSPGAAAFGVNNIYQPSPPVLEDLSVSGFFGLDEYPVAEFARQGFTWADDLSWVHGRHDLRFGVDARRTRVDLFNHVGEYGEWTFNSDFTNLALASFMLGKVYQFEQTGGQWEDLRNLLLGFYGQDTFQATRRLTLDYGLRWEPGLPWNEGYNRFNYWSPAQFYGGDHSTVFPNAPVGLLFAGDPGVPPHLGWNDNMKDWMPRVGFAWNPTGSGKWAVRGGGGMFYDSELGGDQFNSVIALSDGLVSPFAPELLITDPIGPFSNPYQGISNPFPWPLSPPKNVTFPTPTGVATVDTSHKNMVAPLEYDWNLDVEHQLASGWLLRVAYVGSHGSDLRELWDLNPALYIPGSTLPDDARVIFPGYGQIWQTSMDANSNYNSAQVSLEKRFARGGLLRGLTLMANYTYSKSIDDLPSGSGVEGDDFSPVPYYDPGQEQLDYGVSDFNHTNNMVISYDWALPGLANSNRLTRAILGNWETSGVLTATSGFPFTVLAGADQSRTGLSMDRGVVVGGVSSYGPGACGTKAPCVGYLNRAGFALPAIGTWGNAGKNSLTGPGLMDWDMGFFKNFPFGERYKFQFRVEFFNIFNRTNFNNPAGTVSGAAFGTITGAGNPRIGQLALKFFF